MLDTGGLDTRAGPPGSRVGRVLDEIGQHASDTCELFFDDVRVPIDHPIGGVAGLGFAQLMGQSPFERMLIAVASAAVVERTVRADRRLDEGPVGVRQAVGRLPEHALQARRERDGRSRCYKTDYPIARLYADARVQRTDGGSNEVVKDLIARRP